MAFLQQHTFSITPLSPVHIGCNETYEPTHYVMDEDVLYDFSPFEALKSFDKEDREVLNKITEEKSDEQLLLKIQRFFYHRRDALIAHAQHALPVESGVARLYRDRVGQVAQRESNKKNIINQLLIERTFYNKVDRLPVFAGSSLKGAIRTALLDQENKGQPLKTGKNKKAEKNNALQQRLFHYSFREMQKDPLRLLSLSDAHWQATQSPPLPASKVYFAVNRKRHHTSQGRLMESMAEKQGLYQFLECVPALSYRSLTGSITRQNVAMLPQNSKLPDTAFQWSLDTIATACNAFYLPLLEQELIRLDELGYADPAWLKTLTALHYQLSQQTHSHAFLLRLGLHSGAEAMTLNGLRSIRIQRSKTEATFESEPTTLWLASDTHNAQRGMKTFGWVLVEIDPKEESDFPLLKSAKDTSFQDWQHHHQARQQQAKQNFKRQQAIKYQQQQQQKEIQKQQQQAEQQQQKILDEKKSHLSPLAAEFFEKSQKAHWQKDKNAFWQPEEIETWMDRLEAENDSQLSELIIELMNQHFKGVMQNPDKTHGKKNKAVYKPRVRAIAKRLLAL